MIHVHQYFMTALVDARNMLANARDDYGVPEEQNSLAIITHGQAIQGLFRNELWQRLGLGEFYKVNDPKISTLRALAKALGVPVEELITEKQRIAPRSSG